MPPDLYALLGVEHNATQSEIKTAYRSRARDLHPDANPSDASAEDRFKEVSAAYEVLRDPERRRRYDTFGDDGSRGQRGQPNGSGDQFGFGDIFDAFFTGSFGGGGQGGPRQAPDAEAIVELDLVEAAFGCTRSLDVQMPGPCEQCDGSGCAAGTHPESCGTCGGSGEVREVRRSILGQLVTAVACPTCSGLGKTVPNPCAQCRGDGRVRASRQIEVEIPAGIDDGQRLRLPGRGPAAPRGGVPGDLYVTIRTRTHPTLERHGVDLVHRLTLAFTQATLGTTLHVDTLEEPLELEVPAGTQPGHVFRLRGRGVPVLQGRGRGDLLVAVEVEVPKRLSAEEAELLTHLAALRGEDVSPPDPGLFSRLRNAFGER